MRLLKLLLIILASTAACSPVWAQSAFDDADAQLRVRQAATAASEAARKVEAARKALETERQRVVATDGERDLNRATINALEQELRGAEVKQREQSAVLRSAQDARERGLAAASDRRRLEEERQRAVRQPAPAAPLRAPEAVAVVEPPVSDHYELTLRLEKGDTIDKLLADIDVPAADRKQIDEKLQALLQNKKLAIGEQISLIIQPVPDQPDVARVLSLSVWPQPEREYLVLREDNGDYRGEEKVHKVSARIVRVEGERKGSLQQSGVAAGAPSAAMVEFIRALSYDVDFQRELEDGRKFTVLLEQLVTSDGKVIRPGGRLLAGELRLLTRTVTIVRFRPQGGADGFYTLQGENVVRSFLRTPMDASQITLGYSAKHTGVDFAAQPGTPIFAAAAGTVEMAGYKGGYGLYVRLIHTQQIGTGYGQMSRLGPGIEPGVSVRQGQVIGFVGPTGMSTGPHLHYELYRDNQPVNPLTEHFSMRTTLGGKDLGRFHGLAREYLAKLKSAPRVGGWLQ